MIPIVTKRILIDTCHEMQREMPVNASDETYKEFVSNLSEKQPAIFDFIASYLEDAKEHNQNSNPGFMTMLTIIKSLYNQFEEDVKSN